MTEKNKGSDFSGHKKARGPHMIVLMKYYLGNLYQFLGLLIRGSDSKIAQTL